MPLSVTTALLDLVDVILRGVREVCVLEGLIARQVEDEAVQMAARQPQEQEKQKVKQQGEIAFL